MLIIKRLSLALLMLCGTVGVFAQKTALKTNVLYDVTGSINVGAEFELTPKWTFDISGNYNAWDFPMTASGGIYWYSPRRAIGFVNLSMGILLEFMRIG